MKVLIIDDSRGDIKLNKETIFEEYGRDTEVIETSSGEDGVRLFDLYRPDLVLVDLRLPDITGYEVCRRMRKLESERKALILIVTGSVMMIDNKIAHMSGADELITKCIGNENLKKYLKESVFFHA